MRDTSYKSTKTLVQLLVKAAGKGANLLMNVGPLPNGELPTVALERLAQMGEWMDTYGPTIYGTCGISNAGMGSNNSKGRRPCMCTPFI